MIFEFVEIDGVPTLTIKSSLFEMGKHNRAVDAALLAADVVASTSGIFIRKTVLSGSVMEGLTAYTAATREAAK